MKMSRIYPALLALILFACFFGAQGQYSTPTGLYPAGTASSTMAQGTTSQYLQFYQMLGGPSPSGHISAPQKYDITGNTPSTILFSNQGQPVNYPQYISSIYSASNTLWIQGLTSWTQYAQVPQGSSLALLATTSTGGNGYLYEINPNGLLTTNSFYFFPGSSQLGFYADTVGQHIVLFIIDNQVSNSILINVVPYVPPYQYLTPIPSVQPYAYPHGINNYQAIQQQPKQSYQQQQPEQPQQQQQHPVQTTTGPILTMGDTPVHLKSQSIKGYQLYVDGNYIGTDGAGLDRLDGEIDFWLNGDQSHTIKVVSGTQTYQLSIFFEKAKLKTIYVESGKGIYT
jgi:hypothetical protein